jgi:hypothetical protein
LSDGKAHRGPAWKWLDDQLMQFDGGTRSLELYEGWYTDPDTGKRVTDQSRRYFVAMPAKEVERLRVVLRAACLIFQQKCIYLSVAGRVELVAGNADEDE